MSKKSKIRYGIDPAALYLKIKNNYQNKYYNIFMGSKKWKNLTKEEENYVMRKFWSEGTVAAFVIPNAKMLGYTTYSIIDWTMYDSPSHVNLLNPRNVSFIPNTPMEVNKDVVLGYYQRNQKPVRFVVDYYVDRIAQVEMVINTNLQLQKIPYLIGVSEGDITKANDIVQKILNNEIVVFADFEDLERIQALVNQSPYIIDKLYGYKNSLEGELLNYLGIDSSNVDVDKQMSVDEVNANNSFINTNANTYLDELKRFCKDIKDYLGYEVDVENTAERAVSVHENMDQSNSNTEDKSKTGGTL